MGATRVKHPARGTVAPPMLAEKRHQVRRGLGAYMHRKVLVLIAGGLNRAGSLGGCVRQRGRLFPVFDYELGQGLGPRGLH